jgi:hypothetical protein
MTNQRNIFFRITLVAAAVVGSQLVIALANALEAIDAIRWERASGGQIPRGAPQLGKDTDGAPFYACVAQLEGKSYPGKLASKFKGCNIAVNGREVSRNDYEVPVTGPDGRQHWLQQTDKNFSLRKTVSVRDGGGFSYFCSVGYRGGWQLGRKVAHENKCRFGYGGREIESAKYQILMSR